MYEIKTEILEICEAFKLGTYKSFKTLSENEKGFILTEFTTDKGIFQHYYKIKENENN
jgi:hypothetical protein